jgi:hypothetical protein
VAYLGLCWTPARTDIDIQYRTTEAEGKSTGPQFGVLTSIAGGERRGGGHDKYFKNPPKNLLYDALLKLGRARSTV